MTKVIYHKADYDGIFCREIARKFLPDAELIGWDYGYPIRRDDFDAFDDLYMLDISVEALMDHPRLIWIDHHKSAIEKFPSTIKGYRIDGVAACRLAWQWFTTIDGNTTFGNVGNAIRAAGVLPMIQDFKERNIEEPFAVCLAGEYDIWDKHDNRAELFQHGLRSEELNWAKLLENDPDDGLNPYVQKLLDQGASLQYAKTHENESIIKAAGFTIQFEGLCFLACNHARYNSFLFIGGLKPEHDACLGFSYRDGKWVVSLYHAPGKEHHDLSAIAVKYGGGGHRGACGFQLADISPILTSAMRSMS